MTFNAQIDKNKRETFFILTFFLLFISFLIYFIGEIYANGSPAFIVFALLFTFVTTFFSYYNSDKIVLKISGAKEVSQEQAPDLHNLVENMCIASGLPKPRIFMIDDTAMNAFATGRDPEHAVICFTSGIVSRLEKAELEAVVAHELSHIQNYDIRLMSVVSVLVGTVTLLADFFTRGAFYRSRGRDNQSGGIVLLLGLIFLGLSPLIATLIKLAVSRNREFLADASAIKLTRYPQGLANALAKISSDPEILEAANGATAHMYITNPLKGEQLNFVSNLFNTHPPVKERISRIMEM